MIINTVHNKNNIQLPIKANLALIVSMTALSNETFLLID
jgi:hypothetical protein